MALSLEQLKVNGNPQMESMISSAMKMKGDENAMSKINIPDDNGGEDEKPKRLSFDQIREWNKYMATKSNGGDLMTLFNGYIKQNPHTSISFDALRNELDLITQNARRMTKEKNEFSQESAHTGNMFPTLRDMNTGKSAVMNGDMQTEMPNIYSQVPDSWIKHTVPDDIDKLEWDKERAQPYYLDGNEIVYVDKKFYNSERFRKKTLADNNMIASK